MNHCPPLSIHNIHEQLVFRLYMYLCHLKKQYADIFACIQNPYMHCFVSRTVL